MSDEPYYRFFLFFPGATNWNFTIVVDALCLLREWLGIIKEWSGGNWNKFENTKRYTKRFLSRCSLDASPTLFTFTSISHAFSLITSRGDASVSRKLFPPWNFFFEIKNDESSLLLCHFYLLIGRQKVRRALNWNSIKNIRKKETAVLNGKWIMF